MGTRGTLFQTPTVEIDQIRYEELLKHEMQYEQYRNCADIEIKNIIETDKEIEEKESEEK